MAEHVNDPWVKEATRLGYRSRAAFKLIELAAKDKLLRPGMRIVDLGAAPGSWTQVLRERAGRDASIVAIDLLPMAPVPGVQFVQADFREEEGLKKLESALGGRKLRPCGFGPVPQSCRAWKRRTRRDRCILGELALEFSLAWLQPGGDLVVKAFQGEGFVSLRRAMEGHFTKVYVRKPQASRDRSREVLISSPKA